MTEMSQRKNKFQTTQQ